MSAANFSASLGRNQFLELFTKQLQYQDPLEPVKQEDYLQQLATFSQVESLENLNTKFDSLLKQQLDNNKPDPLVALNSGAALLGKTVKQSGTNGHSGIVTEVQQNAGKVLLKVGDHLIPVTEVIRISNAA
jgi:flagellar basal-body rod modification protein FlgD